MDMFNFYSGLESYKRETETEEGGERGRERLYFNPGIYISQGLPVISALPSPQLLNPLLSHTTIVGNGGMEQSK